MHTPQVKAAVPSGISSSPRESQLAALSSLGSVLVLEVLRLVRKSFGYL